MRPSVLFRTLMPEGKAEVEWSEKSISVSSVHYSLSKTGETTLLAGKRRGDNKTRRQVLLVVSLGKGYNNDYHLRQETTVGVLNGLTGTLFP